MKIDYRKRFLRELSKIPSRVRLNKKIGVRATQFTICYSVKSVALTLGFS